MDSSVTAQSSRKRKRPQLPTPEHSHSQTRFQSSSADEDEGYYDEQYYYGDHEREYDEQHSSDQDPGPSSSSASRHNNYSSRMPRADSPSSQGLKSAPLDLPNSGLNRGFACLGCRKRKSKCDQQRPCEQCVKAKMQCLYDDRPQKRPTEVLKERIRDLEEKVRQLESQNPELAALLRKQQGGSSSHIQDHQASTTPPGSAGLAGPSHSQQQQQPSRPYPPINPSWPGNQPPPSSSYGGYFGPNTSDVRSSLDPYGGFGPGGSGGRGGGGGQGQGQVIPGFNQLMVQNQPYNMGAIDPSMFVIAPDMSNDPLPPELNANELISSFLAHRHQVYCDLSISRFWQSLSGSGGASSSSSSASHSHPNSPHPLPPSNSLPRPHPSLLNAIYLIGAFFLTSSSPRGGSDRSPGTVNYAEYEALLLYRARQGIAAALENADRLEDAMQGASLVGMYLYAKGRVLEAYYLACATARFAMGCAMHRVSSPVFGPAGTSSRGTHPSHPPHSTDAEDDTAATSSSTMPLLEPAQDPLGLGQRIHTFWQLWAVDQLGAMSTNLPPALSDNVHNTQEGVSDPLGRIEACLPPEMDEFEPGRRFGLGGWAIGAGLGGKQGWETLRTLYSTGEESTEMDMDAGGASARPAIWSGVLGRKAMIVKSIELSLSAWKLSKHDLKDDYYWRAHNSIMAAIDRFRTTLPSMPDELPQTNYLEFLTPLFFTLAADIQLFWIIGHEHNNLHPSYDRCLNTAVEMVGFIEVLQPEDFPMLELHVGTCWKVAANVLEREYLRLHHLGSADAGLYQEVLMKVQDATYHLARVFPVLGELMNQHSDVGEVGGAII